MQNVNQEKRDNKRYRTSRHVNQGVKDCQL